MSTKFTSRKSRLLAGAATLAVACSMSSTVWAQDDTEDEGAQEQQEDVIVVTGIRSSIANSLNLKKNSTSIVEAISAEDIGKLPDVSIADSLARLPGVTAQRVRGRAQQVSIRGLGPDFSIALLNGREQVSAGNNRGIEFDQFPSELIASGVVYKTPDAQLAATGVAGAVDLRTVRPLDYTDRRLNVSAKYVYNDNGDLNPDFDTTGYRLFGSYIDQNEDGTIGWSLGITHQSNPTQYFSRELKTANGQTALTPTGEYYASDNPRSGVVSRDFERTSVAGSLQFEPTDRFEATVDAYYSDFEDSGIFRGVETPLASWAGGVQRTDYTTNGGPFVEAATYTPVSMIVRTDTEGNAAEIFSGGLNMAFKATDRLTLTADLSTSQLDKNDIDYESYAGTGTGVFGSADPALAGNVTLVTPSNGSYSINSDIDYADPNTVVLADPGGWGQVGFIKEPIIEDDLNQIRLEADYVVEKSIVDSVTAGVLFTNREKSFDSNEAFIRPGAGFTNGVAPIPGGAGRTDSGSIGLDVVAYDPGSLRSGNVYTFEKATFDTEWTVEEEIQTFYAMANLYHDGNIPVRGNVGFQYIDVTQSSTAGPDFVEDSYSDFLPSLNLSFEVQDDLFIRLSAARSVTRPRMDQLRTGSAPGFNPVVCTDTNGDQIPDVFDPAGFNPQSGQTCLGFGGGNPFLRPYKSTGFDAAIEKYFSDAGAISFAVFTKKIEDYVVGSSVTVDNATVAAAYLGDAFVSANPNASVINISGPVNLEEAEISGFEVAVRLPIDDFISHPWAEGFGANLAYTYTDNKVDFNGQDVAIPGYSDTTFSAEVYWERGGWQARVNTRYRSDFLSEIQNFDGSLSGAQALDETVVDAQLGYEWDTGPLEGFGVNFEVYNITDEPFRTENDLDGPNGPVTDTWISRREDYGTTYNITVSKKF